MNDELKKEIKEFETAGIQVVATEKGQLSHVTDGINQNCCFCDSCEYLRFMPDPDPWDSFRDGDQKAVCIRMKATVEGGLETPNEMINIYKPIWCPKLGRELTKKEKRGLESRLKFDKERFSK